MLVKILDADDHLVEKLKQVTGCVTASKAFVFASTAYICQLETSANQREKIARLEAEVHRLRSTINSARDAAALLLDRTAQTDMDI